MKLSPLSNESKKKKIMIINESQMIRLIDKIITSDKINSKEKDKFVHTSKNEKRK